MLLTFGVIENPLLSFLHLPVHVITIGDVRFDCQKRSKLIVALRTKGFSRGFAAREFDLRLKKCSRRAREKTSGIHRLQAVPFWSVERVRSQRSETGARKNKREETGGEPSPWQTCLLTL